MTDRLNKERAFRLGEGHQSAGPYVGLLPSGATVSGTKAAIQEMHAAIWRAQPDNDCKGQSYRDFAERCDRARQDAEQRCADAKKLAEELVGSRPALAGPLVSEILSFLDDVADRYNSDTGDRDGGRPGDLARRVRGARGAAPERRDACQLCRGARGGAPGNENRVPLAGLMVTVCDYCHAALTP